MQSGTDWLAVAIQVAGLIVLLVGGLWAYTRYALERGLAPPVLFSIDAHTPRTLSGAPEAGADGRVLEVVLTVNNVGSSALVASNVRADVRYLLRDEEPQLFSDPGDTRFGHVEFPHSVRGGLLKHRGRPATHGTIKGRGFVVVGHDTFVQAGVKQQYPFVTGVPHDATYVLLWGSFEYAQRPYGPQRTLLWVSRRLGLIHFSLEHIRKPHTAETVVRLAAD